MNDAGAYIFSAFYMDLPVQLLKTARSVLKEKYANYECSESELSAALIKETKPDARR